MSRTTVTFENTNKNLFELCDEWAEKHKYETVESTESGRLYSKKLPIITPLSIFFRSSHKVQVSLSSETVSIECWIAFVGTETETSSKSIYQFPTKSIFRKEINELLVNLGQGDKIIH